MLCKPLPPPYSTEGHPAGSAIWSVRGRSPGSREELGCGSKQYAGRSLSTQNRIYRSSNYCRLISSFQHFGKEKPLEQGLNHSLPFLGPQALVGAILRQRTWRPRSPAGLPPASEGAENPGFSSVKIPDRKDCGGMGPLRKGASMGQVSRNVSELPKTPRLSLQYLKL